MTSRPISRIIRAITLSAVALVPLAMFPTAAEATPPPGNVVANPGFEAICAGGVPCNWQRAAGDESVFTSSADAHSGAASLDVVGNTARGAATECITGISPGDVISLSYWLKGVAGPLTNGYGVARYYSDGSCTDSLGGYVLSGYSAVQIGQWVQMQSGGAAGPFGGTAPAGTQSVRLEAIMGCGGPCSARFDDVSVTVQAAVVACAPGSYSASGNEPCLPAPPGSFVATSGATVATLCSPGKYQDVAGAVACVPAPAGSFVATSGATVATLCSPGSYQDVAGAVACVLADVGFYVPTSGASSQSACPIGSTTLVAGSAACQVTLDSISAAITGFFGGSSGGANGLIAKATAVVGAPDPTAKAGALKAFTNQVNAKIGKPLTPAQAAILVQLAAQL